MEVRPSKLSPELLDLIGRTRARLAESGELQPAKGPYKSPFDEETKQAVLDFIRSGEYRRLADQIGRDDPEMADL